MSSAPIIHKGRATQTEKELLIAYMGDTPQHVNVEDTGHVAMSTNVTTFGRLRAVHAYLGALQLSPRDVAFGRAVDAHVDSPAAFDTNGILLERIKISVHDDADDT